MSNYTIESASKKIFELLRKEHSLQDLVDLGAQILGTYTSYSNSAYKHRAISTGYPKEDIDERENYFKFQDPLIAYKELILALESKNDNTPFIMEATGTRRRWISKSYYGGRHVGHFTVPEVDVPLETVDSEIIRLMSDVCAISYMMQNSVHTLQPFMPTQASLLESVLNGAIKDETSYKDNARLYAQQIYSNYFLMCGTFSPDSDSHIINLLYRQTEYFKYNTQIIIFKGKLVMLLGTDESGTISEALITMMEHLCTEYKLYFGVSDPFQNIMEAKTQFEYASKTLDFLLNRYPQKHILFHDDCKIDMLLSYTKDSITSPIDFCSLTLKIILNYDFKHNTNYAETLKHYLHNNCSPLATSSSMFIHKNTVIYRVKRMEELFNIDFTDTHTLFLLRFSFLLLENSENSFV